MRMNKYAPFLIAVLIHVLFFSLYVFKQKTPEVSFQETGAGSSRTIDLLGFSVGAPPKKIPGGKPAPQLKTSPEGQGAISPGNDAEPVSAASSGTSANEQTSPGNGMIEQGEAPLYPSLARQRGLEGKVRLRAFYNNDGIITQVEIIDSSGTKMLDESARKALLSWKIKKGLGTASFEKTFQFKLND